MHYFKYKNVNKCEKSTLKKHYSSLIKDEKSALNKKRLYSRLATVVGVSSFIVTIFCGNLLITRFMPKTENIILGVLLGFGLAILEIALGIASILIGFWLSRPLSKLSDNYCISKVRSNLFSEGCQHLRDYYKLTSPYILTKCYECSDERFINHDVCIFVVNDELRITSDKIKGFFHGERDLGCYAFSREEIKMKRRDFGKLLAVELRVNDSVDDDVVFLLGYRAKGFIERNFSEINKDS